MPLPRRWRSLPELRRVHAHAGGSGEVATATIRIDPATSRTVFRWPLEGAPVLSAKDAAAPRLRDQTRLPVYRPSTTAK